MFFSKSRHHQALKVNWAEAFNEFSKLLALEASEQKLQHSILRYLSRLLSAKQSSLLLYEADIDKSRLSLRAYQGEEPVYQQILTSEAWLTFLRRNRAPVTLRMLQEKSQYIDIRSAGINYMSKFHCDWVIPLWVEERLIGILNFEIGNDFFNDEALEFVESVTVLSAVALENAHLRHQMIKKNQELSKVAEVKNNFNHQMSEELRKPLTGILGMADYLMQDQAGELNPDQKRYLSLIQASAESFLETIDRILQVSRMESELSNVNTASLDLTSLWQHVQAEAQNFKIHFNVSTLGINRVYADQDLLLKIFQSLFKNIQNYQTNPHKQLNLHLKRAGQWLRFHVEDIGMMHVDCHRLMDGLEENLPLKNACDQEEYEINLGLIKKIVEMHEGKFILENFEKDKMALIFTLPALPSVRQVAPAMLAESR